MKRWVSRLVPSVAAMVGVYLQIVRPRMLARSATDDERTRALPGDDIVTNPTHCTTHGVTISAPPRDIWPWLVQMGQDRAGFYTHNWVERLLRSGIPDVHEIHPEWQRLAVGDLMRTNRDIRPGHPVGWPVAVVDQDRALVVRSKGFPVGTYAYVLEPIDGEKTRLLARDRVVWPWWQRPFMLLVFEPLHTYMQAGVLQGIKARVERASMDRAARPSACSGGRGNDRETAIRQRRAGRRTRLPMKPILVGPA